MVGRLFRYVGLASLFGLLLAIMSNCTMLGLNYASLETANKPDPSPVIEAASLADWEGERAALIAAFEETFYGPRPVNPDMTLLSRRTVREDFADGRARLEELHIRIGPDTSKADFYLAIAIPVDVPPAGLGIVIGQTFSPNCYVFEEIDLRRPDGAACTSTNVPWPIRYIFGEFIAAVPFEEYFDAGFAYASFYASGLVPDRADMAGEVMAGMAAPDLPAPTGTLQAWALGWSAALDVLEADDWLDADRIAIYGHSRHAKSALLAGLYDRRIDAVISHQSGFGGAALSRSLIGEGLARITQTYPHWFAPGLSAYGDRPEDLPVDQHQLLALVAPTPVFLGNGRRDVWSDPNSTYRAAAAASSVYQLHGQTGLGADGLDDFLPGDSLAYFLRPGGHGVDRRDQDAFLAFLGEHLPAKGEKDLASVPGAASSP